MKIKDPILVDECLSPELTTLAQDFGYHAMHVRDLKLLGAQDYELAKRIREEEFIFATNNRDDFLALYAEFEIHNGLIIIIPGGIEEEFQVELFSKVLTRMAELDMMTNRVIEIDKKGDIKIYEWPKRRNNEPSAFTTSC